MLKTKIKVKATGSDAKDLLGMKSEFRGGKPQMKANPQSRQAEGSNAGADSDITKSVTPTTVVPTPEARVVAGFDTVLPVNRTASADSPCAARARNNATRDARTQLGLGKIAVVEIE